MLNHRSILELGSILVLVHSMLVLERGSILELACSNERVVDDSNERVLAYSSVHVVAYSSEHVLAYSNGSVTQLLCLMY